MTIAIVGAGASGMVAALQAAWLGQAVTLFERNATAGRKLLVTGSGRCNITNQAACGERYACAEPAWMDTLLDDFGVEDLLAMLREIGIPVYKTPDGWYYPLSDSAQTVVDAFACAMQLAGVTFRPSTHVTSIRASGKSFVIHSTGEAGEREETFEKIIIAAGGKAYPTLGSNGELFPVLAQLGHTVLPKRPALAPVLAELGELRPLQGIRLDVGAMLWEGNRRLAFTAGNLIFTQWGLNGPAVMDLSHHISDRPGSKLSLSLNLLEFSHPEFEGLLERKRASALPLRVFLGAFFPPKVAALYPKLVHIPADTPLCQMTDGALDALVAKLKNTRIPVEGVRGFEFCQVSAGGVPVGEVDAHTLESHRVSNLYLCGETLDVVGPCGGYNLQYAFSSGALAGRAAARR
ncbi:MAG: aminoacetone oxidase family FAD-binding enzyme [Anaerolineaceae bacterium]|nr:aminoacetone oxidase family FAD-binding enzyme [Anaerolineaceae bacterium]